MRVLQGFCVGALEASEPVTAKELHTIKQDFNNVSIFGHTKFSSTDTLKVKCYRYRPVVAQTVGRGTALLFHDRGTRRW